MLRDLHIENIAVIEKADICFSPGLNVLTGETGAGKSIIIDALQAVLGARVSRELVRTGANKALASAVFYTDRASNWLSENELECEDELVLQRRISEDGKSSSRVCGVPVTATQLRELGSLLLDIHGQNDGRKLMDQRMHRQYLDSFGGYVDELSAYGNAYNAYVSVKKEINRLQMDDYEKERLQDRLRSTIEELEAAEIKEGEEIKLSQRLELLRNSEKLTEALQDAYASLYGDDNNAVSLAESAAGDASRAARYCGELDSVTKILTDAAFMLRDGAERLRDMLEELDFSPQEFDQLEGRHSRLRKLFKKYGGDEAKLLETLENAKQQLDEIEYSDDRLKKLEIELKDKKKAVVQEGERLSRARHAAAKRLEKRMVEELSELSMPSVSFLVDFSPISGEDGFDKNGADEISFLMSANKGEKPGAINRIASGGELSRIMLAMKNVFSENDGTETLVFDEIDTGVSGIAAQRVGEKLAQLSRTKQVLCVTHLPQIAAMADTHFLIKKTETGERTYTRVTALDVDERKKELARLHGGDNITKTTLSSAEEQIAAAESFKNRIRGGK